MDRTRLLPLLFLLGLQACASTTAVDTRFMNPENSQPLQKILLVGYTPETALQQKWEKTCIDELSGPGLEVVPSHKVTTLGYGGGNEPLLEWARNNSAGGVLMGELTSLVLSPVQVPPRDFMRPDREMTGQPNEAPMMGITLGRKEPEPRTDQRLGFRLIRADGTVLWDGVTNTHEANDLEVIAESQCSALAKELRRLGLVL